MEKSRAGSNPTRPASLQKDREDTLYLLLFICKKYF